MTASSFNPDGQRRINVRSLLCILLAFLALFATPGHACAQIFVANFGDGTIGKYSTSGEPLAPELISGLISPGGIAALGEHLFLTSFAMPNNGAGLVSKYTTSGEVIDRTLIRLFGPSAIAVSGNDLFVVNSNIFSESDKIGKYTTSGAVVDHDLIAGLSFPNALAVSGNELFVADFGNNNIGKYTTSGEPLNAEFIPEVPSVSGIAVFRNSLFVADSSLGTISQYNATTGELINPALISGLNHPGALAVAEGYLFVSDVFAGTIGKYTLFGETVDATLISGLDQPASIAVISASVAELSSTWILLLLGLTATLCFKARLVRPAEEHFVIEAKGRNRRANIKLRRQDHS
jgi:hypothetical protein